jgi:hypothetical protein
MSIYKRNINYKEWENFVDLNLNEKGKVCKESEKYVLCRCMQETEKEREVLRLIFFLKSAFNVLCTLPCALYFN